MEKKEEKKKKDELEDCLLEKGKEKKKVRI